MGKNRYKNDALLEVDSAVPEVEESDTEEKKPVIMQTLYTHNKVFKIPAKDSVEDFLKKKYPKEYPKDAE